MWIFSIKHLLDLSSFYCSCLEIVQISETFFYYGSIESCNLKQQLIMFCHLILKAVIKSNQLGEGCPCSCFRASLFSSKMRSAPRRGHPPVRRWPSDGQDGSPRGHRPHQGTGKLRGQRSSWQATRSFPTDLLTNFLARSTSVMNSVLFFPKY